MLEHHPPRRDPRLFVIDERNGVVVAVTLDAWEVSEVATLPTTCTALRLDLTRRVLRTRPSHIIVSPDVPRRFHPVVEAVALASRRPFVRLTRVDLERAEPARPTTDAITHAYPEVLVVADDRMLTTVTLAAALLSTLVLPQRLYLCRIKNRSSARVPRGSHARSKPSRATTSSRRRSSPPS